MGLQNRLDLYEDSDDFAVQGMREEGNFCVCRNELDLPAAPDRGAKTAVAGTVIMGVRLEDLHWGAPEERHDLAGEVRIVEPLGRDDLAEVRIGDASVHLLANPQQRLTIGQSVRLRFDEEKMQFFDPKTEQSLLW